MKNTFFAALLGSALFLGGAGIVLADVPKTVNGVTVIHLEQHNGYFAARETLAGLKPGRYEFVVINQAGKLAGFQIEDASGKQLDMFPLDAGATRRTTLDIPDGGFRYRCPINPTPWYEVGVAH